MHAKSSHLDDIIITHRNIATLQVVFVDVEKYSERRTQAQAGVVRELSDCLSAALAQVSQDYIEYAQERNLNFATDIIKLPTGDGAAVVFTFDGLPDIHLSFARALLRQVNQLNRTNDCTKFENQGWCNCHNSFRLRIGIDEGRGVIFTDLNGTYNAAGTVLNTAARIMGKVDGQQIGFTETAYNQIIDMVDDVALQDHFRSFPNIRVKHGRRLTLYQYFDVDDDGVNSEPCSEPALDIETDMLLGELSTLLPGVALGSPPADPAEAAARFKTMKSALEMMAAAQKLMGAATSGDTLPPLMGSRDIPPAEPSEAHDAEPEESE